jgi:hypothetical protein
MKTDPFPKEFVTIFGLGKLPLAKNTLHMEFEHNICELGKGGEKESDML